MPTIEWTPALETHEPDIDAQHRRLFGLAATLQATCAEYCDDHDRVAEAVYALSEYVLEHFRDEEMFMARCGYPEIGPHRAQHDYLSGRTLQFTAGYMNGDEPAPETLAAFVAEWLTTHILAEDLRVAVYAKHMAE